MATVSRSDQTAKLLQIALIITVALLFVLAVLCYFIFAGWADADAALKEAQQQLKTASETALTEQSAANDLKRILGFPENKPIKDINTETTQAFGTDYADFKDDADTFLELAAVLLERVRLKDQELLEERANTEAEKARAEADKRMADQAVKQQEQAYETRFAKLADLERQFNDARTSFEQDQQRLNKGLQAAQDE